MNQLSVVREIQNRTTKAQHHNRQGAYHMAPLSPRDNLKKSYAPFGLIVRPALVCTLVMDLTLMSLLYRDSHII